jgi:MYXO-CTERM domain-containing protein
VFVLVLAVPALLVVVLGYVVGHAVWTWLTGLLDPALGTLASGAEPAGWITGVLLLVGVVRILAVRRRRRG